jgi:hypothetical protein
MEDEEDPVRGCPNCGQTVNEVYIEDGRCHRCESDEKADSE